MTADFDAPKPAIIRAELVLHRTDGTVQRIEFYGGERNRISLDLGAPYPLRGVVSSKVQATIAVIGRDKLLTIHDPEQTEDMGSAR